MHIKLLINISRSVCVSLFILCWALSTEDGCWMNYVSPDQWKLSISAERVVAPPDSAEGVVAPPESAEGVVTPPDSAEGVVAPPESAEGVISPPDSTEGAVTPPDFGEGVVAPPDSCYSYLPHCHWLLLAFPNPLQFLIQMTPAAESGGARTPSFVWGTVKDLEMARSHFNGINTSNRKQSWFVASLAFHMNPKAF